ncbi:hypothetical protein GOV10_02230 [Candidatus Woesearchaeota archaeon]|nr:hypothetical protein [Candidatus Woesearchaeota archaeon]
MVYSIDDSLEGIHITHFKEHHSIFTLPKKNLDIYLAEEEEVPYTRWETRLLPAGTNILVVEDSEGDYPELLITLKESTEARAVSFAQFDPVHPHIQEFNQYIILDNGKDKVLVMGGGPEEIDPVWDEPYLGPRYGADLFFRHS